MKEPVTFLVGEVERPSAADSAFVALDEAVRTALQRSYEADNVTIGVWEMPAAHLLHVIVNEEVFSR